MASKRSRQRRKASSVNDENSGLESRKPTVSNCEVLNAQMVVEGLRAKYKHKLKEKEINVQPSVQIIETDLPSPTKIAKLEQIKPGAIDKQQKVEDSSKITKLRRVSSRIRRKLVNQNPTKHDSKDNTTNVQESSTTCTSTPIRKDTFEFDSPDLHLSSATNPATVSLDDSCQSSKTEPDKKPNYMKLLDFKTPELKTKKKTGRRRNCKATDPSETTEEEWVQKMTQEFAEVDEFNLIVL